MAPSTAVTILADRTKARTTNLTAGLYLVLTQNPQNVRRGDTLQIKGNPLFRTTPSTAELYLVSTKKSQFREENDHLSVGVHLSKSIDTMRAKEHQMRILGTWLPEGPPIALAGHLTAIDCLVQATRTVLADHNADNKAVPGEFGHGLHLASQIWTRKSLQNGIYSNGHPRPREMRPILLLQTPTRRCLALLAQLGHRMCPRDGRILLLASTRASPLLEVTFLS
jgi:hypothetical protein